MLAFSTIAKWTARVVDLLSSEWRFLDELVSSGHPKGSTLLEGLDSLQLMISNDQRPKWAKEVSRTAHAQWVYALATD